MRSLAAKEECACPRSPKRTTAATRRASREFPALPRLVEAVCLVSTTTSEDRAGPTQSTERRPPRCRGYIGGEPQSCDATRPSVPPAPAAANPTWQACWPGFEAIPMRAPQRSKDESRSDFDSEPVPSPCPLSGNGRSKQRWRRESTLPSPSPWNALQSRHRSAQRCQSSSALPFDQSLERLPHQRRLFFDSRVFLGDANQVIIKCNGRPHRNSPDALIIASNDDKMRASSTSKIRSERQTLYNHSLGFCAISSIQHSQFPFRSPFL